MFKFRYGIMVALAILFIIVLGVLSAATLKGVAAYTPDIPEVVLDDVLSKGDKSNIDYREDSRRLALPTTEPRDVDILAMSEMINSPSLAAEADKMAGRTADDIIAEIHRLERYFDVPLDHDLQDHIFAVCEKYGMDPALIMGVIRLESTFKVSNVGDGGASLGLMQIQPRWHRERMEKLGCDDLMDPYQNILVGVDYLAELLTQSGSMTWTLMAYNGGPGYADNMVSQGLVSSYVRTVYHYRDGYTR